jgi:AcrR family transcriptional regulator
MPRAGLDRSRVIAAAARIADEDGLDAVTFARLAAKLNVKPPSLYNHIEGMTALLDELTALAVSELLERSREAIMGRAGRDAFEALAHTQRAYAKSHPGLFAATFRSLHGQGGKAESIADGYLGVFLAMLREYGFEGPAALHTVRCLRAAIGGFIELELRGGFGMPLDVDESFRRLLDMLAAGMRAMIEPPGRS